MKFQQRFFWVPLLFLIGWFVCSDVVALAQADVGDEAVEFTLMDVDGNEVSLSDFKGKVVALTFWGWGCISCKEEEMPALQREVFDVYSREQVMVISINIDPTPNLEDISGYRDEKKLTYPILVDGLRAAFDYRVFATPILFLIDKDGIIRHREANTTFNDATAEVVRELVDELPIGNAVGKIAIPFTLTDLDGNEVSLSDFADRVVVLTFFGSHDSSCGDMLTPLQQQVIDVYGDQVVVLGIVMDLNPNIEEIKALREEVGVTVPYLVNGLRLSVSYGLPATGAVIIDAEGVIQYRNENSFLTLGFFDKIAELLG